jgi:FkbM family methyltransferase
MRFWLSQAVLLSRLATSRRSRLKLILVALFLPAHDVLPLLKNAGPFGLDISYGQVRVRWWVQCRSDLHVMNELLLGGEYERLDIPEPETILDLGSHIGASLLYFRARYPNARIIGIEPNPRTFWQLERNASQLGAEIHQLAVASEAGEVDFYPAKHPWESSLTNRYGSKPVKVQARTFDGLLIELGLTAVGLLKFDIEGAELEVFRHSRRLADVDAAIGEIEPVLSEAEREELFGLFAGEIDVRGEVGRHTTFVAIKR